MKDNLDESSLIINRILSVIKSTYNDQDIQDVIFSFLKSLNQIYPFSVTASKIKRKNSGMKNSLSSNLKVKSCIGLSGILKN